MKFIDRIYLYICCGVMSMQREITIPGKLLDKKGNLRDVGYSKKMILEYDRKSIKSSKLRIKEWDYYLVYDENYAVAFTIADNGYMGMLSVSLIDFKKPNEITKSKMTLFPMGKFNLPNNSIMDNSVYNSKDVAIEFINDGKSRHLKVRYDNFNDGKQFTADITLTKEPKESMVIVTPFKKPKRFYYNQKIVGMVAQGKVVFGLNEINFESSTAKGILDWGRGVWTYKNTWYWGAGCFDVDGHSVGFNIGYGFGDTSSASENMVFYDGVAHKLEDVKFEIPLDKKGRELYMEEWKFTSSDKRFEMTFTPIIDRKSFTSALVISSNQHQVFGRFNGTIVLDNGKKIEVVDKIGFAEKVVNKW